ncbi:MAG: ATP-binding protein [Nanoarchaeota archaeon]|nr:ATP-binding protein [Nanoarchaeota archaeon]
MINFSEVKIMYVNRDLEQKLKKYMGAKEILAVVGARQCGKTTLVREVFDGIKSGKKKFITFEDRSVLEMFTEDIDLFIDKYVKGFNYLFIDEFQYAKEGGKLLKFIYDTEKVKIVITGSSAVDLSIHSIKFLVGRIFVFELYPFSFKEFLRYKDERVYGVFKKGKYSKEMIDMINKYYDEFVIYGGYPRVVVSKDNEERKEVLKNIYNTYFLKEIKEILQLSDDYKLSKLIKVLALQLGGLLNYNELSNATGFSYLDLLKNLNILKKTFVCLESRPFFSNKKKELVKTSRIYFLDNGLRNYIISNFQGLVDRVDGGVLNENFVAGELVKMGVFLKYWRTKVGAEVDFVIEKNGKIVPLEVKSNLVSDKITRSYKNFIDMYKIKRGFVLSRNFVSVKKLKNLEVEFLPLFGIGKVENF